MVSRSIFALLVICDQLWIRTGRMTGAIDNGESANQEPPPLLAPLITNESSYFALDALSRKLGHLHFVVVEGKGHLRGMVRLDDLDLREDEALRNLILVEDLVVEGVEWVEEHDDLHLALQKLLSSEFDKLPVIRREGEGRKVVGYVMYQDLLQVYDEEIQKHSLHE